MTDSSTAPATAELARLPPAVIEQKAEALHGKVVETAQHARQLSSANKETMNEFRSVLDKLKAEKTARDELTQQVRSVKDKRDAVDNELRAIQDKIRSSIDQLKRSSAPGTGGGTGYLKRELDALEWRQQTENLRPSEDRELSRQIKEIRKILKTAETLSPVQKELDAARLAFNEKRDAIRALTGEIQKLAAQSQAHHEALLSLSKRANTLRKQIKSTFDSIDQEREKIGELESELGVMEDVLDEKEDERRAATHEEIQKERAHQEAKHAEKKKEIQGKAKEIYAAFKAGAKLSLEDL
ncbi:MAG: hypothetical protein WC792_06540, partial [Candidatus Micrarchaeia archaeon]